KDNSENFQAKGDLESEAISHGRNELSGNLQNFNGEAAISKGVTNAKGQAGETALKIDAGKTEAVTETKSGMEAKGEDQLLPEGGRGNIEAQGATKIGAGSSAMNKLGIFQTEDGRLLRAVGYTDTDLTSRGDTGIKERLSRRAGGTVPGQGKITADGYGQGNLKIKNNQVDTQAKTNTEIKSREEAAVNSFGTNAQLEELAAESHTRTRGQGQNKIKIKADPTGDLQLEGTTKTDVNGIGYKNDGARILTPPPRPPDPEERAGTLVAGHGEGSLKLETDRVKEKAQTSAGMEAEGRNRLFQTVGGSRFPDLEAKGATKAGAMATGETGLKIAEDGQGNIGTTGGAGTKTGDIGQTNLSQRLRRINSGEASGQAKTRTKTYGDSTVKMETEKIRMGDRASTKTKSEADTEVKSIDRNNLSDLGAASQTKTGSTGQTRMGIIQSKEGDLAALNDTRTEVKGIGKKWDHGQIVSPPSIPLEAGRTLVSGEGETISLTRTDKLKNTQKTATDFEASGKNILLQENGRGNVSAEGATLAGAEARGETSTGLVQDKDGNLVTLGLTDTNTGSQGKTALHEKVVNTTGGLYMGTAHTDTDTRAETVSKMLTDKIDVDGQTRTRIASKEDTKVVTTGRNGITDISVQSDTETNGVGKSGVLVAQNDEGAVTLGATHTDIGGVGHKKDWANLVVPAPHIPLEAGRTVIEGEAEASLTTKSDNLETNRKTETDLRAIGENELLQEGGIRPGGSVNAKGETVAGARTTADTGVIAAEDKDKNLAALGTTSTKTESLGKTKLEEEVRNTVSGEYSGKAKTDIETNATAKSDLKSKGAETGEGTAINLTSNEGTRMLTEGRNDITKIGIESQTTTRGESDTLSGIAQIKGDKAALSGSVTDINGVGRKKDRADVISPAPHIPLEAGRTDIEGHSRTVNRTATDRVVSKGKTATDIEATGENKMRQETGGGPGRIQAQGETMAGARSIGADLLGTLEKKDGEVSAGGVAGTYERGVGDTHLRHQVNGSRGAKVLSSGAGGTHTEGTGKGSLRIEKDKGSQDEMVAGGRTKTQMNSDTRARLKTEGDTGQFTSSEAASRAWNDQENFAGARMDVSDDGGGKLEAKGQGITARRGTGETGTGAVSGVYKGDLNVNGSALSGSEAVEKVALGARTDEAKTEGVTKTAVEAENASRLSQNLHTGAIGAREETGRRETALSGMDLDLENEGGDIEIENRAFTARGNMEWTRAKAMGAYGRTKSDLSGRSGANLKEKTVLKADNGETQAISKTEAERRGRSANRLVQESGKDSRYKAEAKTLTESAALSGNRLTLDEDRPSGDQLFVGGSLGHTRVDENSKGKVDSAGGAGVKTYNRLKAYNRENNEQPVRAKVKAGSNEISGSPHGETGTLGAGYARTDFDGHSNADWGWMSYKRGNARAKTWVV
ncbi:hypothetical protein KKH56_02590, partial [bacterium]|nr:hypothetical protein [bacterium]